VTGPETHPSWCTGTGCFARGWHVSRALVVEADLRTTGQDLSADQRAAMVRLVQLLAGDSEPHVTLTDAQDDHRSALVLSVRQARILRRFLARLIEQVEPF
jgi:hypothetical protein